MMLLAYRHGLRVGEPTDLRWEDVHLDRAEIYVRRLKRSKSTMQPLQGDELRALRKLARENTSSLSFVFVSEQRGPLSIDAVEYMLKRAGRAAGLPHVHPTCCATAAATSLSTKAPTPGPSRKRAKRSR
jgi:integrase